MPMKEWRADVKGLSIRVGNSWTGGTALYIDRECRDRNTRWFAFTRRLWLSAPLKQGEPESGLVQVIVKDLFAVTAQIVVAGEPVAGDAI